MLILFIFPIISNMLSKNEGEQFLQNSNFCIKRKKDVSRKSGGVCYTLVEWVRGTPWLNKWVPYYTIPYYKLN